MRSMAFRRPTAKSQAPGRSGTPSRGQCWSASSRASWAQSSARSKSPSQRTRPATRRPASSRKMAPRSGAVTLALDERAHLDGAACRPGLGQLDSLVQSGDVDDRVASDRLLGLHERAVTDQRLAVVDPHRGGGRGGLELVAFEDPARAGLLLPPLLYGRHRLPLLVVRHLAEGV